MREPKFQNFLTVLEKGVPDRPVQFELFLNGPLYERLSGKSDFAGAREMPKLRMVVDAYRAAGYDYATVPSRIGGTLRFPTGQQEKQKTISLNHGSLIHNRGSFDAYPWPAVLGEAYTFLDELGGYLPQGMKLVPMTPAGVLENVIRLVGYDNLCYMIADDSILVDDLFEAVGSRIVRHCEACVRFEGVGAMMSNDDWGFNTQTMLSPAHMRRFVFPWHKRIVEVVHAAGKPAILHSCGNLDEVMEDVIEDMRYDGKHSFEDTICPVEDMYEKWQDRIAILGGMDVDFLCRSEPEQIRSRCRAMLERVTSRGGYALGSGNSIPEYVPQDHYMAMIECMQEGCAVAQEA